MSERATTRWIDGLREALKRREADRIPESDCDRRAAVTLILRSSRAGDGEPEGLFVRRAEVPGDPWSGHVALPGGRHDPEDADLLETARRETREETDLRLEREDHLGLLGELHPRSRHLPSVCVTPFVAWMAEHQAALRRLPRGASLRAGGSRAPVDTGAPGSFHSRIPDDRV